MTLELKVPPPVAALAVAGAMWAAAGGGPAPLRADPARALAALALAATGLAFDLAGLWAFRRARTTINPLNPGNASALVTGGVYRWTRNPMYVGLALLLSAWAVALARPWLVAGPGLFAFYITRFQIAPEERALSRLFGAAYEDYKRRVPRWL